MLGNQVVEPLRFCRSVESVCVDARVHVVDPVLERSLLNILE